MTRLRTNKPASAHGEPKAVSSTNTAVEPGTCSELAERLQAPAVEGEAGDTTTAASTSINQSTDSHQDDSSDAKPLLLAVDDLRW